MRRHPTFAENVLWRRLRHRQIKGFHFRRQHPIVRYIVDFYCAEVKLVIEVDGAVHEQPGHDEYDGDRQEFLEALGLRMLRLRNEDVITHTEVVLEVIAEALESNSRTDNPTCSGPEKLDT